MNCCCMAVLPDAFSHSRSGSEPVECVEELKASGKTAMQQQFIFTFIVACAFSPLSALEISRYSRAKALSNTEMAKLEMSLGTQVVKKRLHSLRSHLQDIVLRVEYYTNPFELGTWTKPRWTPGDAAALSQELERPTKKAKVALLSLKSNVQAGTGLPSGVQANLQKALPNWERSVSSSPMGVVSALRASNGQKALDDLSQIQAAVQGIDTVLLNTPV